MPTKYSNGYAIPRPDLAKGFGWDPTYDELLDQTATSNVVDADWPILKDMIKYKLAEAITGFLAMGPPWPLAPEDAHQARTRAYETLDSFGGPPFTIQRLCELALHPRSVYTSLPKYLRAVNRILSVTSECSAFASDDFSDPASLAVASTSAHTLDSSLGVVAKGVVRSPAHHNRRGSAGSYQIATHRPAPSPSRSPSPAATPTPLSRSTTPSPASSPSVVPLLSPIPWLRKSSPSPPPPSSRHSDLEPLPPPASSPMPVAPDESPLMGNISLPLSLSSPTPASSSLSSESASPPSKPLPTPSGTTTPTGGVVDEVDPGSGTGETAEPVALGAVTTLPPSPEAKAGGASPGRGGGSSLHPHDFVDGATREEMREGTSLQQRFVRASSPRVEVEEPKATDEAMEGKVEEGRAGEELESVEGVLVNGTETEKAKEREKEDRMDEDP